MNFGMPYFNPDESTRQTKAVGQLRVKKYKGLNPNLLALNETITRKNRYFATVRMNRAKTPAGASVWMLTTNDGEKYRIIEPKEGIHEVLDMEFKTQRPPKEKKAKKKTQAQIEAEDWDF